MLEFLQKHGAAVVQLSAPMTGVTQKELEVLFKSWGVPSLALTPGTTPDHSNAGHLLAGAERLAGGVVQTGVGQSALCWTARSHPAMLRLFRGIHKTEDLRASMDSIEVFANHTKQGYTTAPTVDLRAGRAPAQSYLAHYCSTSASVNMGGLVVVRGSHLNYDDVMKRQPALQKNSKEGMCVTEAHVPEGDPALSRADAVPWLMTCPTPGCIIVVNTRCVTFHVMPKPLLLGRVTRMAVRVTLEPAAWAPTPEALVTYDMQRVALYLGGYTTTAHTLAPWPRDAAKDPRAADEFSQRYPAAVARAPVPLNKDQLALLASPSIVAALVPAELRK